MNEVWTSAYPPSLSLLLEAAPSHASALAMFEDQVAARPEAPAIHYFDATLTYGEIDALATRLASALVARGLVRGDRVGLVLQNMSQFVIAALAAWKAAAIVVPLNPMYKARELADLLRDAAPRVVVCLESLHETVRSACVAAATTPLLVTTTERLWLDASALPPAVAAVGRVACPGAVDLLDLTRERATDGDLEGAFPLAPDDVALLTYTSGTTGPAKGAMNTHGNVVHNANAYRAWMPLDESDVVVALAPLFHITGFVGHMCAALRVGAPLLLFYRFDAAEALRLIERWQGTFAVAPITAYIALLEHPDRAHRDLASLRCVATGGAPVSLATLRRFQAATGLYLRNLYGLTETTSPSHGVPPTVEAPVDPESGAVSIGVPLPSVEATIVDPETREALPPGAVGEIAIRGPMVVPGYWNRPDESQRAIPDGCLYTGDIGKMDARGWFYVVDRSKDLIVASGFKIWPREVEDVLYEHPGVREACVVGAPDAYRGETVRAFVSLREGHEDVSPEALSAFCKARLAAYKYPRDVIVLADLPKTASGKLLRRELRGYAARPGS